MNTLYNRIAGHSVERLAALSDGIFAVAMTLLAIDLRLPAAELIHSERDMLSIVLIVLFQLNFVLAPRFRDAGLQAAEE